MSTDHHIVEGNERFGYCDKCGIEGDLTTITCEKGRKLTHELEKQLRKRREGMKLHRDEIKEVR